MLKVMSFLTLLAMALAATSAHARLDLFAVGQLLTFNNQPDRPGPGNYLYPECQKIPFLLCDRVCDSCVCDRRAAEFAECNCAQWKPFGEPTTLPYTECIKTCDECFCTLKWPPESNMCICYNHSESKKEAAAVRLQNQLQEVKLSSSRPVAKPVGGFIPYPECMEKCDECVICTKPLPIEKALCYCGKKTASNSKKPALEYAGKLLTGLEVVAKPVAKSVGGFIPYPECMEKCDECVICTKPYPIEKALCYCGKKTEAESGRTLLLA